MLFGLFQPCSFGYFSGFLFSVVPQRVANSEPERPKPLDDRDHHPQWSVQFWVVLIVDVAAVAVAAASVAAVAVAVAAVRRKLSPAINNNMLHVASMSLLLLLCPLLPARS